jgi:hypothetical protein
MIRHLSHIVLLALAGCGAEVVGTAAVGASTQIDAAHQAEEMKANIQTQLDGAAQIEKQKLEQAEAAVRP